MGSTSQGASEELLPLVYEELRKLAASKLSREKPGQTLQATALVHEAYLRLTNVEKPQSWDSRGHFFAAAAEAMRRILINHARDKATAKRGVDWNRVTLSEIGTPGELNPADLLALNDLFESLHSRDPRIGEIAKLRIFAGLSIPEIAEVMNLGARTVDRHWAFARAWLRTQLKTE